VADPLRIFFDHFPRHSQFNETQGKVTWPTAKR
jgi:hypothetical protein